MLDERDNWRSDPLEFISRINSSFDKHMKIDGRTKKVLFHAWMNGSWNKRRMNDRILSNNNTTADSFFKPYFITRGKCNTKKEEEQSQTKHKYCNASESTDEQPNKRMYKAEKFEAIQYSLETNENIYICIRAMWNNVVPLQSDTIRLVQNECLFYELWSEDPNQHLKDFLKLVDSLDLVVANKERTRLLLFQFSFHDQASNWIEGHPVGSISTWEDLTTRFLAQFFPSRRTAKLQDNILMFQQHQGESLFEAWTCFKDLLQKVPHHGIDL
ncbi:zinc finger, CCHC-type containing protein [Tanacetum coccineum]|uniref:Zinc finger, CCHC-type containing protein n=1 Tax=Tanacetum coccineum TaxID=301880 RepID=A0ABQ5GWS5_9ASTR